MALQEITISKGGITVTIYAREIDDSYSNKLFLITPPRAKAQQSNGPSVPMGIDLLRIEHTIAITGEVTGTSVTKGESANLKASEVKAFLVSILKGANQDGGSCTLSYDSNCTAFGATTTAGTDITGFIEKLAFNEKPIDESSVMGNPSTASDYAQYYDASKFIVQLTFLEATGI